MLIYLKRNYRNRIPQWGNISDVERAVAINCEKIYRIDPVSLAFTLPFWESAGGIVHDYSGKGDNYTITGADWEGGRISFNDAGDKLTGTNTYTDDTGIHSFIIKYHQTGYGHGTNIGRLFQTSDGDYLYTENDDKSYCLIGEKSVLAGAGTDIGITAGIDVSLAIVSRGGFGAPGGTYTYIKGVQVFHSDFARELSGIITLGNVPAGDRTADIKLDTVSYFVGGDLTVAQIALFNDLPYALYQPVARISYFFPDEVVAGLSIPIAMHHYTKNIGQ